MIIKIFEYGTDFYRRELNLRDKVLRKPLGLNLFDEDLSQDEKDIHIGAFYGEKLTGCILLSKIDKKTLKMRQVAVDIEYQGQGIGSDMVKFCEKYTKNNGYDKITMHARKTAEDFYLKLGYKTIGNEFDEVGIPHCEMEKLIN